MPTRAFKPKAYKRKTSTIKSRRAAAVSRARTKTIRKVARSVVLNTKELKYLPFTQITAATQNLKANAMYVQRFNQASAMYPAQGDSRSGRDGRQYILKGINIWFNVQQTAYNFSQPCHVYLIRFTPGNTYPNGSTNNDVLFPQSETTDLVTWPRLPMAVGRMAKDFGTVLKKWTIYPQKSVAPEDSVWRDNDENSLQHVLDFDHQRLHKLKFNKRIACAGGASEIPIQMPIYALAFHAPNDWSGVNQTSWKLKYVYAQVEFVDY